MTMDEDVDGFAAEYVLGTLDADERAEADALRLVDASFAAKVLEWERRLGELNVLVAPVEPPIEKLSKGPVRKFTALLVDLKLAPSKAEAERLIKQKAVEIDGITIDDPRGDIDLSKPREFLLRVGKKKFLRIVVE